MEKMAYSIREAVKAGAGSRSTIYQNIKNGSLKARKRGRSTVILADDLAEYLEALPNFNEQAAALTRARQKETPAARSTLPRPEFFLQQRSSIEAERDDHMSKSSRNQP